MPLMRISDSILAGFADFAHGAAPAALAALWQDAMVALALVVCLRFVLRVSAAHRFAVCAVGFGIGALLQFLPLLQHSGAAMAAMPSDGVTVRPWFELDSRWGFAIAALWLAASVFRGAELGFHSLRLRRLWRGATPVEAEANHRSLLASALPSRRFEICTTPDLDRPSVIGFFAPRILIPEWLYPRLTPGELEQVVLHEAEHLRRHDDWTNLLQKFALVLFPLNPALVWMERRLCREREMACDEGVVERTQAPRTYAACLTSLAERGLRHREFERRQLLRRAQALSLGAFERRSELVSRVDRILRRSKTLHPLVAGALVGIVACGLVVGAVELSRSPELVAFVAAPKPHTQIAAIAQPDAPRFSRHSGDRMGEAGATGVDSIFRPSVRYRAFETKSVVPAARSAETPVAVRSRRSDEALEAAMTEGVAAPHQAMMRPRVLTSVGPSSQSQELIVLTTWEEVETSAPQPYGTKTREIADYETGADAQTQSGDATSGPDTSPAPQISVTRLILLVVPANAATGSSANPARGSQPAHTTSSQSHRPTASAFDGGWLFFQL